MNMKKNITPKTIIPLFKVFMSDRIIDPLSKVMLSGYIGQGKKVDEFEKLLSNFIGNPNIFTVNSGTSALNLALRLAGVSYGDEVISTPMTCTATNWPILNQGAKIVWADIDPLNGNIEPKSIQKLITKKTKAILVVDWGGYPCDIDEIRKFSGKIPIVEDAAHAFGSVYKKKKVGNAADYTCYSFQAIKHLTTVDGGAVAVRKIRDYKRGILLRWYGISRTMRNKTDERIEIDVNEWGYKFHMNDVNATIGIENIKYTEGLLKKHRENAVFYRRTLQGLKGIRLLKEEKNKLSSYWLFTILVENRKKFMQFMKERNIHVSQVHRRNDTHPTVKAFKRKVPGVDEFSRTMVAIPVGWWVTKEQRRYIASTIHDFAKEEKKQNISETVAAAQIDCC